jgi:ATPase subunit of ABC transporter with duplicated ATPase domains
VRCYVSIEFLRTLVPVSIRFLSVSDLSFSVNPGDRIAVVGPNGAGKSTLLALLSEQLRPSTGEIAKRRELTIAARARTPHTIPTRRCSTSCFSARGALASLATEVATVGAAVVG